MINDVSMTLKICHFLFFNVNGELQMILETKISNSQLREIIRLFEAVFFFNLEWSFFCMKQIKYICKKLRRYPKFIIYRMVTFLTDGRSLGLVPDETNSHLNFHFLDAI